MSSKVLQLKEYVYVRVYIYIYIYILSTLSKSTILEVRVKYMNVSAEQIGRRKIDNKNRSE